MMFYIVSAVSNS